MNGFEKRKKLKKTSILNAAGNLFMSKGIQATSIDDVAKEASVSKVTIYNYFESKNNLLKEMFIFYIDKAYDEFLEIINKDISFKDKIKMIMLKKNNVAVNINKEFYDYLMKEYSLGKSIDLQEFMKEKGIPLYEKLFDQGRKEGFIDPNLSTESIMVYLNMITTSLKEKEIYDAVILFTEDIMKLFFYGLYGER